MEVKRVRPRWSGHETLEMMDSGIGYTQDLYRPAQLVGRKRRADDDSLLLPGVDAPDSEGPFLGRRAQIVPPREVEYRRPDRDGPQITYVNQKRSTNENYMIL